MNAQTRVSLNSCVAVSDIPTATTVTVR